MRELIIDRHKIIAPLFDIVKDIKSVLHNGKLKIVKLTGNNIQVTCPCSHHKNGQETKASAYIYIGDDATTEYGCFHCFACGTKSSFSRFVAECFDQSEVWAKNWLIENYAIESIDDSLKIELDPIILSQKADSMRTLDERMLNEFDSFHPYMLKRKLTKEVCKRFEVKYDAGFLIFPVRDEAGNLVMLTRRSVYDKRFIIDKAKEKPVYLLYYLEKNKLDTCFVTESQINCLTCHSYNLPAVALFGTGSKHQYDILNKSGIRHYILCFDGDKAGKEGAKRFLQNIRKDVLIDIIEMPPGKDINDLTENEFLKLLEKNFIPYNQIMEKYKNNCID